MEVTTLPRQEYFREAVRLKVEEGLKPKAIRDLLGEPRWDDIDYWLKSAGPGKLSLQTLENRKRNQRSAAQSRQSRIRASKKELHPEIRKQAAALWDELIGDRDATFSKGGKSFTFDQFLDHEVREHTRLTKAKYGSVKGSLGHGAATTSPEYVESYTQMMDEPEDINYLTGNKVPPNQAELLKQADMPTSAAEAAKRHTNPDLIYNPIPDAQQVKILKSPLLSGTARKVLQRSLGLIPLVGSVFNAADAAERSQLALETNDPLDILQASIATTSVGSTGWAEPVGFAADVGNTLIDLTRFLASPMTRQQLNQGARQSFTGANTGRY